MLTDGCRFLSALADDEFAFRGEADGAGEFAHVRRLSEGVREEFVDVGFTVSISVAEAPDAVAIEDVNFFVADRTRHRLVQARSEAVPVHRSLILREAGGGPHVAVDGDHDGGAIFLKLNITATHGPLPRIGDGQVDVIDDVCFLGIRAVDGRCHRLWPARLRGAGRHRLGRDGRSDAFVAEGNTEGDFSLMGGDFNHPEVVMVGELRIVLPRGRGDADPCFDFLGWAVQAVAHHEPKVPLRRREGNMSFDDRMFAAIGGGPPFADFGILHGVLEDDLVASEVQGRETSHLGGQGAAADFLGARGGRARICEADFFAPLPSG